MAGKQRFRVLVGLSYPTDPQVIEQLLEAARAVDAGKMTDEQRRAHVLRLLAAGAFREAAAGAIVDDIPAVSVPWLLEQGQIEAVTGHARRLV